MLKRTAGFKKVYLVTGFTDLRWTQIGECYYPLSC